jgi:hypothetical protein
MEGLEKTAEEEPRFIPGLIGGPKPISIEQMLREILKEVRLQSKMVGELLMNIDEKRYGRQEMMEEAKKKIAGLSDQAKGTPFEAVFKKMAEDFFK